MRYLLMIALLSGCDASMYVTNEKSNYTTLWTQKDGEVSKDHQVSYEAEWDTSAPKPKAKNK